MAVTLAEVNDYINPSQACINPLFTDKKTDKDENKTNDAQSSSTKKVARRRRRVPLTLEDQTSSDLQAPEETLTAQKRPTLSYALDDDDDIQLSVNSAQVTTSIDTARVPEKKDVKATLSVADCLACSGCITSAEAVLVTQHSVKTLVEKCAASRNDSRVAFTISPAVIADLTRVLMFRPDEGSVEGSDSVHSMTSTVFKKLTTFLSRKFNADLVLDGTIPQKISLLESALEFCERYRYIHGGTGRKNLSHGEEKHQLIDDRIDLSTPSIALSATETRFLLRTNKDSSDHLEGIEVKHDGGGDSRLHFLHSNGGNLSLAINDRNVLPMLASSCPGFVCYVEKTVMDAVPNLCTVKSPMAIAGSLIKHDAHKPTDAMSRYNLEGTLDSLLNNGDVGIQKPIFHVSIMPCHDKKLEAERKDLAWETFNQQQEALVPDVDLVITTNELCTVLDDAAAAAGTESGEQLSRVQKYFLDLPTAPSKIITETESGGQDAASTMKGSGSYADFIFRFASSELFGYSIPADEPLPWKKVGNSTKGIASRRTRSRVGGAKAVADSSEICLFRHSDHSYSCQQRGDDDVTVLKFATAYGFKNIQMMMSKTLTGEMKMNGYHYVESMACPSGCLNGGGQTHASNDSKREKPSEMRNRVEKTRTLMQNVIPWMKPGEAASDPCSTAHKLLHTRFHVVPKLELSTGATAGVAIDDTLW